MCTVASSSVMENGLGPLLTITSIANIPTTKRNTLTHVEREKRITRSAIRRDPKHCISQKHPTKAKLGYLSWRKLMPRYTVTTRPSRADGWVRQLKI